MLVLLDALVVAHLNPKPMPLNHKPYTFSLQPSPVNPQSVCASLSLSQTHTLSYSRTHTISLSHSLTHTRWNLQSADDEVLVLLDALVAAQHQRSQQVHPPAKPLVVFWFSTTYVQRGFTFALRCSAFDFCLGGQRSGYTPQLTKGALQGR